MLITELLLEGRDAPLYHGTSKYAAYMIIKENAIRAKTSQNMMGKAAYGVSLTRSFDFGRHMGYVIFELDQHLLRCRYRIFPHDYWGLSKENIYRPRRQGDKAEAEEFVIGDIIPLEPVLIAIHVSEKTYHNLLDRIQNDSIENRVVYSTITHHPKLKVFSAKPNRAARPGMLLAPTIR